MLQVSVDVIPGHSRDLSIAAKVQSPVGFGGEAPVNQGLDPDDVVLGISGKSITRKSVLEVREITMLD